MASPTPVTSRASSGRRTFLAVAAVLAVGTAALSLPAAGAGARRGRVRQFIVGALLPLSGELSDAGEARRVALNIAAQEVNQEFEDLRQPFRLRLLEADTGLDPAGAVEGLKRLAARNVWTVIGPVTSAELEPLGPIAERKRLLVVSPDSTASSLAIPGDSIYRFAPSDVLQGKAIAALLQSDSIRAVVPIWRDDSGNAGAQSSLRNAFTAAGGTVTPGVAYSPDTTDFAEVVRNASAQVTAAEQQHGAGSVAVFLSGFNEVVGLFHAAEGDATLAGVRWYGSDGSVQSPAVVQDERAARFAERVGFPSTTYALDEAYRSRWEPLQLAIEQEVGFKPDALTMGYYDALWVAAIAHQNLGGRPASLPVRQRTFARAAARYFGATGWTLLDNAGDRAIGTYDFWAVRQGASGYEWQRVARFDGTHLFRE